MENQLTNNIHALRLFFNDDIFLVDDKNIEYADQPQIVDSGARPEEVKAAAHIEKAAISTGEVSSEGNSATVATFTFLGGNQKSILILVNDEENDVSNEEGREVLRKIVLAMQLKTADFALLNYAKYPKTSFAALKTFFNPLTVLSFGVGLAELGINQVEVQEMLDISGSKVIVAPNLKQLVDDASAKKALWMQLKMLMA